MKLSELPPSKRIWVSLPLIDPVRWIVHLVDVPFKAWYNR